MKRPAAVSASDAADSGHMCPVATHGQTSEARDLTLLGNSHGSETAPTRAAARGGGRSGRCSDSDPVWIISVHDWSFRFERMFRPFAFYVVGPRRADGNLTGALQVCNGEDSFWSCSERSNPAI